MYEKRTEPFGKVYDFGNMKKGKGKNNILGGADKLRSIHAMLDHQLQPGSINLPHHIVYPQIKAGKSSTGAYSTVDQSPAAQRRHENMILA